MTPELVFGNPDRGWLTPELVYGHIRGIRRYVCKLGNWANVADVLRGKYAIANEKAGTVKPLAHSQEERGSRSMKQYGVCRSLPFVFVAQTLTNSSLFHGHKSLLTFYI